MIKSRSLGGIALCFAVVLSAGNASSITISTTSGALEGVDENGVMSFKGIRYGQSPTGDRRWEPPLAFTSTDTQDATKLGPSCIQQFEYFMADFVKPAFNNPPPPEDEDCLFLNVWTPSGSNTEDDSKPVVVWIHGGDLKFGTGSLPVYDGASIASNQNIVVVTINYRTNIFGFPASPDLPIKGNNLGFLDQDLALSWVQSNIAKFGGDPRRVTIMGQSAGGLSVSTAITRHTEPEPPFRAAVMLSGNLGKIGATPIPFNDFAAAVNCTDAPGSARLACLKAVPAEKISEYVNGPDSGPFGAVTIDDFTAFKNPIDRIVAKQTARVPVLLGSTQDDGSIFYKFAGTAALTGFLAQGFRGGGASIPLSEQEQQVRFTYSPGLNDTDLVSSAGTDFVFQCPASLWAAATVSSGIADVYRYIYGPVFPELEIFPGAGAYHASELSTLFGTFDATTATPILAKLSATFQTAIANFIKDPTALPAPQWARYDDGNVAKLAFEGNVETENVVQMVSASSVDGSCALWDVGLGEV